MRKGNAEVFRPSQGLGYEIMGGCKAVKTVKTQQVGDLERASNGRLRHASNTTARNRVTPGGKNVFP